MSIRQLKARGLGRLQLLSWLNEFLETDYSKIEHLADGIAYCQVFDALYPNKVNLHQVNFNAKSKLEYERNLRILLNSLHTLKIQKDMNIPKLVDGVFQEHFEFLHWIHDYVHRTYPKVNRTYSGYERRKEASCNVKAKKSSMRNNNLVPTYSHLALQQFRSHPLECLSLDLDNSNLRSTEAQRDQEVLQSSLSLGDLTLEDLLTKDIDHNEIENKSPKLQYVKESYIHTYNAFSEMEKVEEYLKIYSDCMKMEKNKKKNIATHAKVQPLRSQSLSNTKDVRANDQRMKLDDIELNLNTRMSYLVHHLESELKGRVEDLKYMEEEIQKLRQKVLDPPNVCEVSTISSRSSLSSQPSSPKQRSLDDEELEMM